MTPEGFARIFSEGAEFIVNGDLRGRGPEALSNFFGGQKPAVGAAVVCRNGELDAAVQ